MSILQSARTTPAKKFAVNGGMGVNVSTAFAGSLINSGKAAATKVNDANETGSEIELTEDEARDLIGAAFTIALFSPMPITEIGLRYGIREHWDAGISYTSSGFRFETKVQLVDRVGRTDPPPFDVSIGLQAIRQTFEIPVIPSVIKTVLDIKDFERTDLIVPLLCSRSLGDYGYVYGGPRVVYTFLQAEFLEKVTSAAGQRTTTAENMLGLGGSVGAALGYKYVFVALELNVVHFSFTPTLLGTEVDLSGTDFYPALGFAIAFHEPVK